MSTTTEVTQKDLHDLLETFEKRSFDAGLCEEGSLDDKILKKCECLFRKDYSINELDNTNGVLSTRYPSRIFIPEQELGYMASTLTVSNANIISQAPSKGNNSNKNDFQNQESCSSNAPSNSGLQPLVTFSSSTMQQNQTTMQQNPQQPPQYPYPQSYIQYPALLVPQTSSFNSSATSSLAASTTTNTIYEDQYDVIKIREHVMLAKYARCRQRFVVPVIMYRGKFVCRSATISINAEAYGRKVVDYAYDCLNPTNYGDQANRDVDDENNDNEDSLMNQGLNEPTFSYEEVIKSDIQLLNVLNVSTIVDLMVENRKIKYFMAVSLSEKADPEKRYKNFNILSLPYPGCEFFKKFRDNNYTAENLHYDWSQSFNDAPLDVPNLSFLAELNINWNEYKQWDLVLTTQNYLKTCLKCIQEEKSGLLIHCISGWDRTPLFISLLRLSMWADGLIHQSLNIMQITYFTLAYDWYLFGHQLPDRLKRGEDILVFCFHMLKFIATEEFSIVEQSIIEQRKRTKTTSSSGSSIIVIKSDCTDDDQSREEFPASCDQDSNESFSNVSNCDMSITDNFYTTAATPNTSSTSSSSSVFAGNPLTNRSPNSKRTKTSPISVPGASATRQRQESTSSNGSWLLLNEAGSVDSTVNSGYMMRSTVQQQQDSSSGSTSSANNCNFLNPSQNIALMTRQQRLNSVRILFSNSYGKTVGLKLKEGSSINTLLGTITDQLF